ncbi:RagB/SusD family nutrient uptake outer membrane protein [Plebeiibacterium sediminum]|uniref:RagB/SusD family nutrient uptake outer membrane protein n=1 Tax=Plebeiibacterium sediminum TaxID=2992112 RepID=A0AAE3M6U6_9BACT|nr:RagB/SusD family nutrient uptake outer membrane protein [Plebeiobacterium sediminum]MCW3787660.1 RagB/SusD family nutrient uptake outer membrane protein [Plebeiobacterium sediminum]
MKKILFAIIPGILLLFSACEDTFLDLDPLDASTEAAYFSTPEHFKAATNDFYNKMIGLRSTNGSSVYDFMDFGTDLTGYVQDYGRGVVIPGSGDSYWTRAYIYLRAINIVLDKAKAYNGDQEDIAEYVAVSKFFRAYHHFVLLQRFGGVPIVTKVIDLDSPELLGARHSRYEVFEQIIKDLDDAIAGLPLEKNISDSDKGKISKWAAMSYKAKALLYEATWEKNVGTTTDGDGVSEGAGSAKPTDYPSVNSMLTMSNELAKDVMDNGGYSLWNYNSSLENWSMYYLFNLEDEGSNPAGLTKASNSEFILYTKYDYDLYQGNVNISHTVGSRLSPSRKYMDMFLCSDGLPVEKSSVFEGYYGRSNEFKNRDYRLTSYFGDIPEDGTASLIGPGSNSGSSYGNRKFASYNYGVYRAANTESFDFPQIRLAEVYLIYAETLYELKGALTDAELNASINKIKARAGLPALTNAFAVANGLDMYEEIKRERTVELYAENSRYNDLKRWGIAEEELNQDICGDVIEGTEYENNTALYNPAGYPYGEITKETGVGPRRVLLLDPAANRNFARTHYLMPIPLEQINLNSNLLQNPGY